MENENKTTWEILSSIDCREKIEKKKTGRKNADGTDEKLSYLSWAWAWGILKEKFPDANYSVREWDGRPYLFDDFLGYLVETSVTINGETISMRLPVMDGANKAMKSDPYKYHTKYGDRTVEAATMFDINTAIMRCLTKNLAMFGLGHFIYVGEDLPKETLRNEEDDVLEIVKTIEVEDNLNDYYRSLPSYLKASKKVIDAFSAQKTEILQNSVN